ncbi:MAG: hypothetical protein IJL94_00195, partial [Erysipelotrichaceae bacterium]|nr:hypothetical protein [Erysipelotrichaceae bacterium]
MRKWTVFLVIFAFIVTSQPVMLLADEVQEEDFLITQENTETEIPEDAQDIAYQEEEQSEVEERQEETVSPAFEQSTTVNGVIVSVSAPEGIFPADAELSVTTVSIADQESVENIVEDVRDMDAVVAVSYTFDIKVLDSEGNEIQPADDQKVTVAFSTEEVADSNLETDVYHISDDGEAEKLETEINDDEVCAETDGFSFYTVEFTYHELQYVMEGDTTISLREVLDVIGLEGEVSAVECSNEELFSASMEDGEWFVTAHQAFTSEEWMKVNIHGVDYTVEVTDQIRQ